MKYLPIAFYLGAVVLVNILFSYVPMIATPLGLLSPVAILVGTVFIFRDYAQRATGHLVLVAMVAATIISYMMADPFVAVASALAFASSEIVDWILFTVTKKPFGERVFISSLVATPVDTVVFLLWINDLSLGTFVLMVISKMIASAVLWAMYRDREHIVTA